MFRRKPLDFGVNVRYCQSPTNVFIQLPFDRYYLNEKLAPSAEAAYREHSRRGGRQDTYATVRVHNGRVVIKELYVAGKPIQEFVKQ